jgi:hypothetical protein
MAEPTLIEVFGAGATQTPTTITILKSDLPMTAAAVNGGERILAAICKKAATVLLPAGLTTNADQSISVQSGFDSIVYRTFNAVQSPYLQSQLTFNFAKIQVTSGITPDDY